MKTTELLLKEALLLKPQDKLIIVEELIKSLDEPDNDIDRIWLDEAQQRLINHRKGKSSHKTFEEVFGEVL
jgi:hypothetical protein